MSKSNLVSDCVYYVTELLCPLTDTIAWEKFKSINSKQNLTTEIRVSSSGGFRIQHLTDLCVYGARM